MKYIMHAFQDTLRLGLINSELISNVFKEIEPQLILRCFGRSNGLLINPVKTI